MTVICSGTVKLSRRWPGEREPILILAHRGQILGEEAALSDSQRVATVTAMTPGKALRVSSEDLGRLLKRSPSSMSACSACLASASRRSPSAWRSFGQGSVEERLARVLLRVGHEVGLRDAGGIFLPLRLTRRRPRRPRGLPCGDDHPRDDPLAAGGCGRDAPRGPRDQAPP
ncbi:MAG: cyclic nucleotide-binding domain-containing protein [Deltaproteobacteria bacterium]|nr:cyclic nucleotide-binding domain-containing protein [Deltaproteobacteria bacterium]